MKTRNALFGIITFTLALAAQVQAQFGNGTFLYSNNGDGTCTITGYYGAPGAVTIPTNIGTLTVTTIGSGYDVFGLVDVVFSNRVTSVTIPASVTSIGAGAFFDCTNLSSVTIPNSVTSIGDSAFSYCEKLTNVTVPSGITSIGNDMFFNCFALASVTIPASVTSVGTNAFAFCDSLTGVYFQGNAPTCSIWPIVTYPLVFYGDNYATAYYLPDTTGWGSFIGGIPTVLWHTPPTIVITSPTGVSTYSTTNSTISLGGTASDGMGVTNVTWSNPQTGGSGTASGTTSWTANEISLARGTNVITVTAYDAAGDQSAATLTVTFNVGTVTLIADPTNGGVVTGGGTFATGSQIQISATANTGWTFTGWNDGNTQNPRTITVPSNNVAYVADFAPTAAVTLIAAPWNGGTVNGGGTFEIGSQVQIAATANTGWTFTGWNDGNTQNPRTITVPSGGAAYAASFLPNTAVVTVIASPWNGGTVNGGGTFEIGSQVQIAATANTGWTFTGWNDGNTQSPRTITVPSNGVAYAANFAMNTAVVTVIATPWNGGTVNGGGTFEIGSQVQIAATANTGWTFTGWNDGNTQSPRTITVRAGGAAYAASFMFVPTIASYSGLFYDTNGIAIQSSGFFNLTMTAKGTFTAKLQLAGESYPFSGSFSTTGLSSNSVLLSKTNRLTIQLGFNSGGLDILSGQLRNGNWTAELVADRAVYSKTNLAPQAGKYTVLIPGSGNAAVQPGGDGFGSVTVDHYGNLSFGGTLGDGSSVSQTAVVSGQGQWPLYVSLYSGKGSILGWLNFASEPASDIAGAAVWTKLRQPTAKFYPAGFTNQTEAVGSLFQFTNGVPVLNFAAGELWLTNGNLAEGFTNQFTLGKNSKVTDTNKMSLTISTASGLFTGSVVNPATKKAISIYGAVLQKQNIGAGYFLGTNESGEVFLGPVP